MSVLVIGPTDFSTCVRVDGFPVPYEPTTTGPDIELDVSGTGGNVAIALAALDRRVSLVTQVGTDVLGNAIVNQVRSMGIDLFAIRRVGPSARTVVLASSDGQRRVFTDFGACDRVLESGDIDGYSSWHEARCVILSSRPWVSALVKEIDARAGWNIPIIVDLQTASIPLTAWRLSLAQRAQGIFISHEALGCKVEQSLGYLLDNSGADFACVGLGARGAVLASRNGTVSRIKAPVPPTIVSTAGAGDALVAKTTHGILSGQSVVSSVEDGVQFATWSTGFLASSVAHMR